MPELPEVETIKNDLKKKILKKRIVSVGIIKKSLVRGSADKFVVALKNNAFIGIDRIGKLMMFELGKGKGTMLVHLKMTGQLVLTPDPSLGQKKGKNVVAGGHFTSNFQELPNKHTHIIFTFADRSRLFFNDMRQFGYLEIVDDKKLALIKSKYGIEPLQLNYIFDDFKKVFKNRKISVKAVLLNQNLIAGIGNIYADEILFEAGVRPDKKSETLKDLELKKIFQASRSIIKKAIKHRGTTFSDYVDTSGKKGNFSRFLRVYGRDGEKCFRCSGAVKKMKVAGRGTRYCEKCQK